MPSVNGIPRVPRGAERLLQQNRHRAEEFGAATFPSATGGAADSPGALISLRVLTNAVMLDVPALF